jgi:hypothetical protein
MAFTQADDHRRAGLDVGPIREGERHQDDVKASQHQPVAIGSPSWRLVRSGSRGKVIKRLPCQRHLCQRIAAELAGILTLLLQ